MERLEVVLIEKNPGDGSKPIDLKFTPIFGDLAMAFGQDIVLSELCLEDGVEAVKPIGLYDPRIESQVLIHDSYGHTEIIALRGISDDYRDRITMHATNSQGTVARNLYRISREQLEQS